jgi:hypothetical protein
MSPILALVLTVAAFWIVNVAVLRVILALNRREAAKPRPKAPPLEKPKGERSLDADSILGQEFEYISATASEAMQDRHTMVNFYLLVTGILGSGLLIVMRGDAGLPTPVGAALLWLLCGVGWLYFLKIVRLRQAWYDSAQAMNTIKDFYIQYADGFEPEVLRKAFLWKSHTLPLPDKPWTVFFYSAMLIGFLDSVAFMAGGTLLFWKTTQSRPWAVLGILALFGLAFFVFHVRMYFAFLKKPKLSGEPGDDGQNTDK